MKTAILKIIPVLLTMNIAHAGSSYEGVNGSGKKFCCWKDSPSCIPVGGKLQTYNKAGKLVAVCCKEGGVMSPCDAED